MKLTENQLRNLIREVRWQYDPSAPGGMSHHREDQWVLERSGVAWTQKFLVNYDMNKASQDPIWGPLESAMKFDSRQMAHHYGQQIERSTGLHISVQDASKY